MDDPASGFRGRRRVDRASSAMLRERRIHSLRCLMRGWTSNVVERLPRRGERVACPALRAGDGPGGQDRQGGRAGVARRHCTQATRAGRAPHGEQRTWSEAALLAWTRRGPVATPRHNVLRWHAQRVGGPRVRRMLYMAALSAQHNPDLARANMKPWAKLCPQVGRHAEPRPPCVPSVPRGGPDSHQAASNPPERPVVEKALRVSLVEEPRSGLTAPLPPSRGGPHAAVDLAACLGSRAWPLVGVKKLLGFTSLTAMSMIVPMADCAGRALAGLLAPCTHGPCAHVLPQP